jgi:hypothetical protein
MEEFYTIALGEGHRELASRKQRLSLAMRARSESPPVRCFQVDREILAGHPWDCVLSALYE